LEPKGCADAFAQSFSVLLAEFFRTHDELDYHALKLWLRQSKHRRQFFHGRRFFRRRWNQMLYEFSNRLVQLGHLFTPQLENVFESFRCSASLSDVIDNHLAVVASDHKAYQLLGQSNELFFERVLGPGNDQL